MSSLKDKVTIITGASSGLGAGIARYFIQLGVKLVLVGSNADKLHKVSEQCKELGPAENVFSVVADLSTDQGIRTTHDEAVSHYGQIDVLINNAGILHLNPMAEEDPKKFDKLLDINLKAPYRLTQLCIPELSQTKGAIINMSSIAATYALPTYSAYCISKAALDHMTRCSAVELGQHGIRVNAIHPGVIPTEIYYRDGAMTEAEYQSHVGAAGVANPLCQMGTEEDVAKMAAFLASPDSRFTTGAGFPVDGGMFLMGFQK